ncbi:PqqD family protein [Rhizorhabdus sp. FW153]|uniref:PqqD family protein n=1 Tax=Rhizorhabdus sp. FW153 TaxID=3400216 RepID=UPI003CF55994
MGQKFHRKSDVFEAEVEESVVLLLNADTGSYHSLNPVAGRIWELLAEPIDEDSIITQLVEEFAVTVEECRREVAAFLPALRARGLIVDV